MRVVDHDAAVLAAKALALRGEVLVIGHEVLALAAFDFGIIGIAFGLVEPFAVEGRERAQGRGDLAGIQRCA